MSNVKLAVVFVPGAWHGAVHFNNISDRLARSGYEATIVELPSVGPVAAREPLAKDVVAIRQAIQKYTSVGKNVVVGMHSYGGVCGSEAVAEVFEEAKMQVNPSEGRVVHLFFQSAIIIPRDMSSSEDELTHCKLDFENDLMYHIEPYHRFYEHCTPRQARKAIEALRPHAINSFFTKMRYQGWSDYDLPVTYLSCTQDRAIEYEPDQMRFKKRFEDAGVDLTWKEMETDHSPWLSREDDFCDVFVDVLEKAGANGQ